MRLLYFDRGIDMSKVNISGFVDNTLKERTTVYSPLIEAIVNSIEAISEKQITDGKITVTPIRKAQMSLESDALPEIIGFSVEDNGIGFSKKNRDAFDTLCTDIKKNTGGKGLGRFIFLKYFSNVKIRSVYEENSKYHQRIFTLGKQLEIIENETDQEIDTPDTGTTLILEGLKRDSYDKELNTIARKILEKILVFFISDTFNCPTITLTDGNDSVVLNTLIGDNKEIQHICDDNFLLGKDEFSRDFQIKIYKITYPGTVTSKLCLTAHSRQVTETSLHKYITEFKEGFHENIGNADKNYIIRAYVLGAYLDESVSPERGQFNFGVEEADALYPFSQQAIEKETANVVEKIFKDQVQLRRNKKLAIVKDYTDTSAPWHKTYVKDLNLASLPYDLDEKTIEAALQEARFKKEQIAKAELKRIIDDPKKELFAKVSESVQQIQEAWSSDLTHYVVLRKIVLDMLGKLLEMKDDGKYSKESDIHNLIFPMRSDSEETRYSDHNLWILDEKLNFTEYISSDKSMDKEGESRPDLMVVNKIYDKKWAYRSGNEPSNPITIFEFKQPQREDFVDPSKIEDPIEQIIRYARGFKEHKYKTPTGRDINVDENTPFYGYLICDITEKVRNWVLFEKDFIAMPDKQGYFHWHIQNRLFMEVLSWDKVLKDAGQRNKIFFEKLGLNLI